VGTWSFATAEDWKDLFAPGRLEEVWQGLGKDWMTAGSAELDAANPRRLAGMPGQGVVVNSPKGRARDLITREKYQDVEVHVEFCIARGSNSGIKLMGLYEIQIVDSRDARELSGDCCGGIYPRAEDKPSYHHIDKGTPPRVNAARPAGQWQELDIVFQAPRFDSEGKKTASARFVKVILNQQLIHENVEVATPTGAAWRLRKETAAGPLLLQGDHGPVAFRNVRIRPLSSK
jgi:hypothetical protein